MKVAVISDTHDLLRPELLAELQQADRIMHAGDICCAEVVKTLRAIAPLDIVRGNNDKGDWAKAIPETLSFTLESAAVFMLHDLKQLAAIADYRASQYDLVICGHSHKPLYDIVDGQRVLNPGSCGPRRFTLPVSMAWLTVRGGRISVRFVDLLGG